MQTNDDENLDAPYQNQYGRRHHDYDNRMPPRDWIAIAATGTGVAVTILGAILWFSMQYARLESRVDTLTQTVNQYHTDLSALASEIRTSTVGLSNSIATLQGMQQGMQAVKERGTK